MSWSFMRRGTTVPVPTSVEPVIGQGEVFALAERLQRETSGLGLEAAQLRGTLDDTLKVSQHQQESLATLVSQLDGIRQAQELISTVTAHSEGSVGQARAAVESVGNEVVHVVGTLKQVAEAARQITAIALQTRLVAFNASVEAKRAGEAGRGFSVVADAVKDLSTQVESTSKAIMSTVAALDTRIQNLERDLRWDPQADPAHQSRFQTALTAVQNGVDRIQDAAQQSMRVSGGLHGQASTMSADVQQTRDALEQAMRRGDTVLGVSEALMQLIASCGVQTADSPYIELAQQVAASLSGALEQALSSGMVSSDDLFDAQYRAMAQSNPVQYTTRFNAVTDRLFPAIQEAALQQLPQIVFCLGTDRNGYISTHNRQYCQTQRAGDVAWNTAHSRWRRIFNDRTGLASARNEQPFLLQTYRRDMGGGQFVMLKEASAPIRVGGQHWGGVRLAYRF